MTGTRDTLTLIAKFRKRLRRSIFEKLVDHRFSNLVDCYVATSQVENTFGEINAEMPEHVTQTAVVVVR